MIPMHNYIKKWSLNPDFMRVLLLFSSPEGKIISAHIKAAVGRVFSSLTAALIQSYNSMFCIKLIAF